MAFEDLIANMNAAVIDQLSDTSVTLNGGAAVRVRYDREYAEQSGAQVKVARVTALQSDFPGIAQDDQIVHPVDGAFFAHTVEQDAHGMVQVGLRRRPSH